MRRLNQDQGASAVIVALMLAALIGAAGLSLDVGEMYSERRELQTGADAGALAIAEDCGLASLPCDDATGYATADYFADANASDGAAAIDAMLLDLNEQRVQVITQTETLDGSNLLPPIIAQVVGYSGTTVRASAIAVWGSPRRTVTLPLIFSDCEWAKFSGTIQPGPTDSGTPTVIQFHDGRATQDCAAQAGQDTDGDGRLPGGFGWLATDNACTADVEVDDWVYEDPGASPSTGCSAAVLRDLILNKVVLIPYFDDVQGLGSNGQYQVAGFGAFFVTGYNFGGQFKEPSGAGAPCTGDVRCIAGYLTSATASTGDLGGPDRGVVIVKLIG